MTQDTDEQMEIQVKHAEQLLHIIGKWTISVNQFVENKPVKKK